MMGIVRAVGLIYWAYGALIVSYRLFSANTQVNYDYSLNDLHAVMGNSYVAESGIEPKLTTMGADFPSSPIGARITLPPNDFVSLRVVPGSQFSLLFWLYPTSLASTTLIERYDPVAGTPILNLGLTSDGGVYAKIKASAFSTNSIGIATNTWQMVTVLMDCLSTCTLTAYKNLGETSAISNTGAIFTDEPSVPFTLGYTQVYGANGYVGKINDFMLFTELLSLADLGNYLAYAGTLDCLVCFTICAYHASVTPPDQCLTATSTALSSTCINNCGASGILACTHYMDYLCFMVGRGCDPTCYTCLNGLSSGYCDTCYDLTNNWVSSGGYWGQCVCRDVQYRDLSTYLCQPCYASCSSCNSDSSSSCTACISDASLSSTVPSSCPCNSGYFLDTATPACQLCDSNCVLCSGAGPTMCLSCYAKASLTTTPGPATCVCNSGFFPNSNSSNCSGCHSTCAQCQSSAASACTVCKSNASLAGTAPNSCECSIHFYPNTTSANCSMCSTTCNSCTIGSPTSCMTCYANAVLAGASPNSCICDIHYFPSPNVNNCLPCDLSCRSCSGYGVNMCNTCYANAHLSATAPNSCLCNTAYYPNPSAQSCSLCASTCAKCSVGGTSGCTQCLTNAVLTAGSPSSCVCQTGFYPDLTAANCKICDSTCFTCSGLGVNMCVSCYLHAHMSGTVCLCISAYYPDPSVQNCAPCDPICAQCSAGGTSKCTQCFANAVLAAGSPSSCVCQTSFYPNLTAASCVLCNSNCLTCSGPGESACMSCYAHANLSNGIEPGSCLCDTAYYPNPSAQICAPCDFTCVQCSAEGASGCTKCGTNAVLTAGPMSSCACQTGFFSDYVQADCLPCATTCQSCSGSSVFACTTCYTHAHLNGTAPSSCLCDTAYFPNPSVQSCAPCDSTCAQCSVGGEFNCTQCQANAVLNGNPPTKCLCSPGFYTLTAADNCQPCHSVCLTCSESGPNGCLTCYSHASLSKTSPSSCICDPSYFPNTTAQNCSACDVSCVTCSGPEATMCSTCYTGASISKVAPSACLCATGTFFNSSQRSCMSCDPSCLTCTAATKDGCTSCPSPKVLASAAPSACQCAAGSYSTTSGCQVCPGLCAACASASACTSCKAHSSLSGSVCLCDSSSVKSADGTQCLACDSTCQSCVSPLSSGCLTCKLNASLVGESPAACFCQPGYTLAAGSCVLITCDKTCARCSLTGVCLGCQANARIPADSNLCVCQDGYYPKADATNCLSCSSTCLSCSDGSDSACLQCKPHAVLTRSAPSSCQCAAGFFPSPNPGNCQTCPQGCAVCSESSACSKCAEQYFLGNSGCMSCNSSCQSCILADICLSCKSGLSLTTSGQCLICPNCGDALVANATGPVQYDYNITFNRPVLKAFTGADLSLAAVPNTSLSWSLPSGSSLIVRVSGGPWANVSALLISFVTNVTDIYGFPLTTKQLTVPPPSDPPGYNETALNTTVATATQASAAVVAVSAVVLGSTVGGGSIAMALLSQMQYFSYIGTANYSTTGTTTSFYADLNQKSSIPNVFQRSRTPKLGRKLDSVEELIVVKDFLDSAGQYITLLAGLMALHLLFYLATKVVQWKWLKRLERCFVWTVYLYFWYFAFLDLQISALLQLKDGDWQDHSPRYLTCTVLAVLTLVLTCSTPFAAYLFIYRYKEQLIGSEDTLIKQRFGSWVSGLRADVRWAKYLVPVFYFQRLLYSLLIVFMRGRPMYQSLTLIIPCGLMTLFTLAARPMLMRSSRLLHIIAEIDALLVYILLCFATLQYNTPQVDICWVIVGFTLKSFLCTVLIVLIHAISGLCSACRKKAIEKESKVYVETLESTNSLDFRTAMWGNQKEVSFGGEAGDFRRVHPQNEKKVEMQEDALVTGRSERESLGRD